MEKEPTIPKFKSKLKDATVSGDDKNFIYTSSEILLEGDENYKLMVNGYSKINCGCVIVKNLGSKGFKMSVDTSKLTKSDAGEHIIQTDLSLEVNDFKTESESFKLTITYDDKVSDKTKVSVI